VRPHGAKAAEAPDELLENVCIQKFERRERMVLRGAVRPVSSSILSPGRSGCLVVYGLRGLAGSLPGEDDDRLDALRPYETCSVVCD
jgi:hypothetical protein